MRQAMEKKKLNEQMFEPIRVEEQEPKQQPRTEEKKDEEDGSSNGQMKLF